MYLSYQISIRKPDKSVFENLLNNHDLNPEETLFIDDMPEHIKAAKKLGIRTYLIKDGDEISKINLTETS